MKMKYYPISNTIVKQTLNYRNCDYLILVNFLSWSDRYYKKQNSINKKKLYNYEKPNLYNI